MVICKSHKKSKCKKPKCSWIQETKRKYCRKSRRKKYVAILYPSDLPIHLDMLVNIFKENIGIFKESIIETAKINDFNIGNISRFKNFNNLLKYLKKIGWENEMYIDPGNFNNDISRIFLIFR